MFRNLSPEALGVSGLDSSVIELILSNGFKGLDLDILAFAEQVKAQGMARAGRLIVSARLKVGSIPLPVRWEHDGPDYKADLARLPELLKLAQEMGCSRATTFIEPGSDTRPYHENFEFHRRRFAELGDVLAGHKFSLGVGFLAPAACRSARNPFIQVADAATLLLRSVSSKNVGLAFDSWHWHLGGGTLDLLASLGTDKIITVALADCDPSLSAASATLESRRLPGDAGAIDFPATLTRLAELRYEGPVTPLADKSQLNGLSREKIVKLAGEALDRAWKAAGLNVTGRLATVPGR